MKCILKEFDTIDDAEDFINVCIKNKDNMANLSLFPYAVEPSVVRYLVSFYQYEESDKELK